MNDEEIIDAILTQLNEFDQAWKGSFLNIEAFVTHQLNVDSVRRISQIISLLEREKIIENQGINSGNYNAGDYFLTEKGINIVENGGWLAYKIQIKAREDKFSRDAQLAEIKVRGEALQFKYWWVGLAGFAIAVITGGWTIYQDLSDDPPTREEFNLLRKELDQLKSGKILNQSSHEELNQLRSEIDSLKKKQIDKLVKQVNSSKPTSSTK